MGKEEICNIKYSQILNYSNSGFEDSNRYKCKIVY